MRKNIELRALIRRRTQPIQSTEIDPNARLERAKAIATIFSAIAIPIVLTVAGYYIQRQLASEGLKKDYVGIAAGILKDNPANQEPELRAWAVAVLDVNSPIPFSKKAKEGLRTGLPVVVPGPAWLGPPDECRKPSSKRTVLEEFHKLSKTANASQPDVVIQQFVQFIDLVVKQEEGVLRDRSKLECIQKWTSQMEQSDIDYRKSIGALSSKSVYEEIRRESAASAAVAASRAKSASASKP